MKFKLTDLGKLMEAQLTAGSKPIITKIEASDAYSSNDGALLSVQNKKQDLEIEEIVVVEGASHLRFVLHNVGLAEEYMLRQVGIYARQQEDAEEILYIIGQDKTGERVPAASEKLVEYEYDLMIHTENTYGAEVVVKGSYFATKAEMEEIKGKMVSADEGDISNTKLAVFDDFDTGGEEQPGEEPADVPDARTAITEIKKEKKLSVIISNIKAALMGLVTLGEMRGLLVNNGLCNEPGKFFLDAAYGKNLQDQLTKLNSDFIRTNIKSYISINDEEEMEQQVARHIGTPGFYFLSTSEPKGHPEINYSSGFFLCRTNTYTIVVFAYDSGSIHIQSGYKDINGHHWTGWKKLNGI